MIYLVLLFWDNGPQRGNALISLFHSTLDFEGTGPARVEAQPLLATSDEVAPCPFINKGGEIVGASTRTHISSPPTRAITRTQS